MDLPPISLEVWDKKYRYKEADGTPIDLTLGDTWERVAMALGRAEKSDKYGWAQKFLAIMSSGEFSPAGRIIAGLGTSRDVTASNCYVMGTIPDSISGIFDSLRESALTLQQGGGIGMDFSTIRPKGALVKGVAADASGPLSFMDVWDSMCRTIMSAGSRRGAMMATMRCDHPDIEAFIAAKKDPLRLRMFNVSVLVTDNFMEAVKHDYWWDLKFDGTIYKNMHARDLWQQIMESTYAQAEPGVIFIDRMNRANNLRAIEVIAATNPCGEEPLPPYGACLLGSINLANLVHQPFQDGAALNLTRLRQVVTLAIRALDNVIDVSNYPLEQQRIEAQSKRRIGLGETGLADALLMCGLNYDSEKARNVVSKWMYSIAVVAYEASIELAKEKGAFYLFNADEYLATGTFASTLPKHVRDGIREHGIRNSHLLSIAPTGTISLLAGNVSSGIEPIFAAEYTRKVLQADGSKTEQKVVDYAVALWRELGNTGLPPAYTDAQSLSPSGHVLMQAVCQEWVDTSISKTTNLPKDISFEDFQGVYQLAYDMGCKGCTTYRPNDITGSVLSVETPQPESEVMPIDRGPPIQITLDASPGLTAGALTARPQALRGTTYKIKMGSAPATYVTINDINDDWANEVPFELFLSGKDVTHHAWMAALSRMISAIFRRGGDVAFVVEELRSIHDPKGGAFIGGKYVPSLPAAIGDVIAQHMGEAASHLGEVVPDEVAPSLTAQLEKMARWAGVTCPKCQSYNVKVESGCVTCLDCGHSTCG